MLLFLLLSVTGYTFCQQTIEKNYEESKWEYLVFTLGKTYFGSPQKAILYSELIKSISSTYQEGNNLEKCLDLLGEYGWELVNIIGNISSDQQIVLKRIKKDFEIEKEKIISTLITNQEEEINKSIKNEKEKDMKVDYLNHKNVLIDLDEVDIILSEKARYEKVKSDIEEAFNEINDSNIKMKYVIYNDKVIIDVDLDITDKCLNDNTYRKTEVASIIGNYNTLFDRIKINTHYKYVVRIDAFIRFIDKNIIVGQGIKTNNFLTWINAAY